MTVGIWEVLVILLIVLLVFGTKKLRNIGADLGGAVRGFKEGIRDGEKSAENSPPQQVTDGQTIEGEIKEKTKS